MDPQGFNANSRLRASDADRDTAAAVINNALAEGRLSAEEHSERLDAIYAARTQAELVPLLEDLPGQRAAFAPDPTGQPAAVGRLVAIFSATSRKGVWHAEPVMSVLSVFGSVELDFREAILPGKEVVLRGLSVLGAVEIVVPPEMRVVDNGVAILGAREITGNEAQAASPDSPVLRIEGCCVLGAMEVHRKARKTSRRARRLRGVNVSIEPGAIPAIRIRPGDSDD